MQPNTHKTIKIKSCEKGDYERSRRRIRYRKAPTPYQVDFSKAEEVPESNLEKEVQRKIAVEPEAFNNLVREEEKELFYREIDEAGLSSSEQVCIRKYLEGVEQKQIAESLNVIPTTVQSYLERAREKLIRYVRERYKL